MKVIISKFSKKSIIFILFILFLIASFFIYVSTYYPADLNSLNQLTSNSTIEKQIDKNNNLVFKSPTSSTGFIFYPGGKVDENAYDYLAIQCANRGITTIVASMPFNLAVFNIDSAESIIIEHPEIKQWYIGGHSLGGSMAAIQTYNTPEKFKGIILLGSYSTSNLSDIPVLSIYGSEDKILNHEKYSKYKNNISANLEELIIPGGNHASFGTYGFQKNDGHAKISNKEQITITAQTISNFIYK